MNAPALSFCSSRRKPALLAVCDGSATPFHTVPAVRHFAIDRAWLDGARLSCPGAHIEYFTPLRFAEAVALRRLPTTTCLILKARTTADLVMLEVADALRPVALIDAFDLKDIEVTLAHLHAAPSPTILLGPAAWAADLVGKVDVLPGFDTPELRVFQRGETFVVVMSDGERGEGGLWSHDGEVAAWVLAWELAVRVLAIEGRPFEDPETLRRVLRENRLRRFPVLVRVLDAMARHGSVRAALRHRLQQRR